MSFFCPRAPPRIPRDKYLCPLRLLEALTVSLSLCLVTVVSSTCQLLCKMSLSLGLSDVVLMMRLRLWVLGGDIKFSIQNLVDGRASWPWAKLESE